MRDERDSQEMKIPAVVACGERERGMMEKRGLRIGGEGGGGGRMEIKTICRLNLQYCSQLKPAVRSWLIHQNKHFLDGHELRRPVNH